MAASTLPTASLRPPLVRPAPRVTRVLRHLLLLAALGALAAPAGAQANPVRDCSADNDLDKSYSNRELDRALDNLPSEIDEYSNCRDLLTAAIASGSDRGGSRPSSGGAGSSDGDATPAQIAQEQANQNQERAELEALTEKRARPSVEVGGERVTPGPNGLFDLASANNSIPVPLVLALIAVGLLLILGALLALRERVPALARLPLLSKIPRVSLPRFRR